MISVRSIWSWRGWKCEQANGWTNGHEEFILRFTWIYTNVQKTEYKREHRWWRMINVDDPEKAIEWRMFWMPHRNCLDKELSVEGDVRSHLVTLTKNTVRWAWFADRFTDNRRTRCAGAWYSHQEINQPVEPPKWYCLLWRKQVDQNRKTSGSAQSMHNRNYIRTAKS